MNNVYKFGAIPSLSDERDYHISRLVAPVNVFPDTFVLDYLALQIKNQGEVGSCVGHSLLKVLLHIIKKRVLGDGICHHQGLFSYI